MLTKTQEGEIQKQATENFSSESDESIKDNSGGIKNMKVKVECPSEDESAMEEDDDFSTSSQDGDEEDHSESGLHCSNCNIDFTSTEEYRDHMEIHGEDVTKYPCMLCDQVCFSQRELKRHTMCDHVCFSQRELKRHTTSHRKEKESGKANRKGGADKDRPDIIKPLVQSDFGPNVEEEDKQEKDKTEIESRIYECLECNKSFKTPLAISNHMYKAHHNSGTSNICPVCHKTYSCPNYVLQHLSVHTGEKPYPCPICGRRFRIAPHVKDHMRTHTGEKPYACDMCDKKFTQSSHLRVHALTHAKIRHKCKYCFKEFKDSVEVEQHQQKEHENPYECSVDGLTFAEVEEFNKHVESHKKDDAKPKKDGAKPQKDVAKPKEDAKLDNEQAVVPKSTGDLERCNVTYCL